MSQMTINYLMDEDHTIINDHIALVKSTHDK